MILSVLCVWKVDKYMVEFRPSIHVAFPGIHPVEHIIVCECEQFSETVCIWVGRESPEQSRICVCSPRGVRREAELSLVMFECHFGGGVLKRDRVPHETSIDKYFDFVRVGCVICVCRFSVKCRESVDKRARE